MKQRQRRKQFWWTWHHYTQRYSYYPRRHSMFDLGIGRIKHQQRT
jgi:hypothetical protein